VSAQVDRRSLERWLVANGFVLEPGKKTGHKQYSRDGIKISVPGHGPQDLTKKHVGLILRQLARLGFDPALVRRELAS
jgi:predicted RNA binding protein YcfA (HicA-like mRNA interferase family)